MLLVELKDGSFLNLEGSFRILRSTEELFIEVTNRNTFTLCNYEDFTKTPYKEDVEQKPNYVEREQITKNRLQIFLNVINSAKTGVMYYPPGMTQLGEDENDKADNMDIALNVMQARRRGKDLAIPDVRDSQGRKTWEFIETQHSPIIYRSLWMSVEENT